MSQHPVDRLIRELIGSGQAATAHEIERIVERMATAPFEPGTRRVPVKHRGLTYLGHTLSDREESLFYHLVKRVLLERQWPEGTMASQYLVDLRRAVRDPAARLALYTRWGGAMAATVTPTGHIVPSDRSGPRSLPQMLVIYSADRGTMVTGYEISALGAATIPREVRWLK